MVAFEFDEDKIVQVRGKQTLAPFGAPVRVAFWSANFCFGEAAEMIAVPYDPALQV